MWPFWRPKPLTSLRVIPVIPICVRASFTSSILKGLTIALIFFTTQIDVFGMRTREQPVAETERLVPLLEFNQNQSFERARLPKGGHFAAWEQPELFTQEMRAAFKSLR
jgi:pimeloyl-ACP methyl ester carboxylesterase